MEDTQINSKEQYTKFSLIWHFLKGCKAAFIIGIIATLVSNIANMFMPQIIRFFVDNIILKKDIDNLSLLLKNVINDLGGIQGIRENLWIPVLALIIVSLVKSVGQYVFRVYNTKGAETLSKNMRDQLFNRIVHLPFSWQMKNRTGDIIQRCTSDIDTLQRFVSQQLADVARIIITVTLAIIFMLSMNVKMTIAAGAMMPIIFVRALKFHKNIRISFEKCDETEGLLSAEAQENLTGVRVVRAFGRERYEKERFEEHNEYYTGLWEKVADIMARFWATSDILSGTEILLLIAVGCILTVKGEISVGEYIAFISYNEYLVWPIRMLGRMLSEMSKAGVSVDRIAYIMNSEPETDPEDAGECDMCGDIEFNNINFAYEGYPELLQGVSFKVKSGQTVGILGGTGSGKSTLMLLLDKMYNLEDENSSITIGGTDIRKVKTDFLRKNIGMVLQEPFLFSRTLAENIGIRREGITLEEVRDAARAAALDDTAISFSKGYETFVGERGITLSGGQKQRTAIARVLTEECPIMIFDDSLSAVDTETDEKIRKALEKRFGKSTIFLISHRITTLQKADVIVVLDRGRISEIGSHDILKNAGGIYESIYRAQSSEEVSA